MRSFTESLDLLLQRIDHLGTISDSPSLLTRHFLSPANLLAARTVEGWMQETGMFTSHNPGGTIRGILPGSNPGLPPLVLGSHLDTVIDAGRFDGPLGVLIAIAALEITGPLPYPVHVLGFSDEEGSRFHATYLGSRSCLGGFPSELLDRTDADGITLRQAIASEGWHLHASEILYPPHTARGYLEVHIEQGRVLEEIGHPLAAVSAISGQSRLQLEVSGQADHAGTTPMPLRRDALAAAAACILEIERFARENPPLVATVGRLETRPGASNAIPGLCRFTLDFRHPAEELRIPFLQQLIARLAFICIDRDISFTYQLIQDQASTPCDPQFTRHLSSSIAAVTGSAPVLPSGAGHDAVMMALAMPVAMLFVRCRSGLSHHPDEFASPGDIAAALQTLVHFLRHLPPHP